MHDYKFFIYSFLASFVVGFHIFSFKYIDFLNKNKERKSRKQYILQLWLTIIVSIIAFLLSRFFIFKGMQNTNNPAMVHIILNLSVFVTLALSVLLLKSRVNMFKMIIGTCIVLFGLYVIQMSVI